MFQQLPPNSQGSTPSTWVQLCTPWGTVTSPNEQTEKLRLRRSWWDGSVGSGHLPVCFGGPGAQRPAWWWSGEQGLGSGKIRKLAYRGPTRLGYPGHLKRSLGLGWAGWATAGVLNDKAWQGRYCPGCEGRARPTRWSLDRGRGGSALSSAGWGHRVPPSPALAPGP